MIKRLLTITIILFSVGFNAKAQYFLGLQNSGFAGVNQIDYTPAIADSRFITDINLISVGVNMSNNYIGLDRKAITHPSLFNDPNFKDDHLTERVNGKDKNVYIGTQIMGPLSFMCSFGKGKNKNKNAFGFTYHVNTMFNADKISEQIARIAYYGEGYKADSVVKYNRVQLNDANVNTRTLSWVDYGITYSRVVYDKGDHMVKVGGTLKLLEGVLGGYAYVKDLKYKFQDYDTLTVSGKAKYAYSQGFVSSAGFGTDHVQNNIGAYAKDLISFKYSSPSVAVDLGATYEWRPDQDKYKYQMDCEDKWRFDKNRYKLAVGLSIMDIGGIRFKKGDYSGNFEGNAQDWYVKGVKFPNGLQSIDDSLHAKFQFTNDSKSSFTMWLPTRINAFIDYNIAYGFGANLSATISPNMAPNRNMVHQTTTVTLTPKYEHAWFGFYMPVSYDVNGNVGWGATIRVGPLIIGSADLLGLFTKKFIYNADIHAALKITIPYHKIRDHDHDGVSNRKDQCKKEKGTCASHGCPDRDGDGVTDDKDKCPDIAGPVELGGCPDADGDGIIDPEDSCVYEKGLAINHGCPDRDSDGIVDKLDECPDLAGLAEFNGCPDRDSDGIPDKLDLCPDIKGPKEHFGCPDTDGDGVYDNEDRCILTPGPKENTGCPWPDRDADGVADKDDECPDVFGLPENHGCPALEKKELETVRFAFENLEFETGKDVIRTHSFPSLNALAQLLVKKSNYGLRIEGHTDNVGKDEMNLILSQKRATAVKNYLVKRGVKEDKLESFGYGASKPVADNDTPAGRQKNRRVEMKILFK